MLLFASTALAASLDVQAFTSFPTAAGLRATAEGPARLRFTGSVGLLPDSYLAAINGSAQRFGWYDATTADYIDASLQDAVSISAHGGWRPFPAHGFQFELGYGFIGLGGGLTGGQVVALETGYSLPDALGSLVEYDLTASLHRVEATVGWEWTVARHVCIRADLGASYTAGATARIEPDFEVPWFLDAFEEEFERDGETKLEETLTRSVHTPIVALGAGYRF